MSTTVNYKGSTIATVSNEMKTLETAGTWLEGDIQIVDVTENIAELSEENGYIILPDAVSSGVVNILSAETESETILTPGYYKVPTGYKAIFNAVYPETPILKYNWDLTQSLEDTIEGAVITLGNATRDSSGIHLTAANSYATIPVTYRALRTYEFDVVSMSPSTGTTHGRFLMFNSQEGLIYRSGANWNVYLSGAWETNGSSDGAAFAGHTLSLETESSVGVPKYYLDGDIWWAASRAQSVTASDNIMLGSNGGYSFYNAVISGVRVYEGVKYS